jgi:hypothetical protein
MKLIYTYSKSTGKKLASKRVRKRVKQSRIINIPVSTPLWVLVGGPLLTVYKAAGEFTNERGDTCVDMH